MSRKALFTIFLTILTLITPSASFAAPKAGASCPKAGKSENLGNKRFTCIKSGKKLIWNKGVSVAKPLVAPSTPSPTPTPESPKETVAVYPVTSRDSYSKLETCKIKTTLTGSEGVGFPRSSTAIPSLGTVKGVTLFVEFPDLKDDGNPLRVWRTQQVPTAEKYYKTASYGKLDFKVDLVEKVYFINKSVLTYNLDTHHDAPAKPNAKPWELVLDAMTAADSDVDFSKYDYVNVVTPATTMIGFEGAIGLQHTYDGKLMQRATFGPIREYVDSPPKYNWLIHESGHLFGLMHPYNTSGNFYPGYSMPIWDIMGHSLTETPEFLAWHKFLLGWLDVEQVNCIDSNNKSDTTHLISPLTEDKPGVKTTIVKLSETQALVVENRRKSPLNDISETQGGILTYIVDGTIKDGQGSVTFIFSKLTTTRDSKLIGTLKPGESIKHKNVTVKVLSSTAAGDYVSVVID
ncbi:M6dom_TIGR03296, M6 family metalloprotease domain [Candidatus Nanopelagicaceae bacterium]